MSPRQANVFTRRQYRYQSELLRQVSDRASAQLSPLALAHTADFAVAVVYRARVIGRLQCEYIQKCRLARAGRSGYDCDTARIEISGAAVKHLHDISFADSEALADIFTANVYHRFSRLLSALVIAAATDIVISIDIITTLISPYTHVSFGVSPPNSDRPQ